MKNKEIFLPPFGCIEELAKLTGFHRNTVSTALRKKARGEKAEKVRQLYREKYLNQTPIIL